MATHMKIKQEKFKNTENLGKKTCGNCDNLLFNAWKNIKEKFYILNFFENIKKSNDIKHICTISKDNVQLSNDEHIPVNNDVLVLLIETKSSHILEKYINDY